MLCVYLLEEYFSVAVMLHFLKSMTQIQFRVLFFCFFKSIYSQWKEEKKLTLTQPFHSALMLLHKYSYLSFELSDENTDPLPHLPIPD